MYVISWWESKVVTRSIQSQKIHQRNGDSQENETIARPSHNDCIHIQIYPGLVIVTGRTDLPGFFLSFRFLDSPPQR